MATAPTSPPDPETGIITGEQLTKAAGEENSDAAVAARAAGRRRRGPS